MFDISWTEFLLIGVVALIVIGPKELPGVMRTMGQWTRKIRGMAADFQGQFQEAMREAEMTDLKKQVDDMASDLTNLDPLKSVREDVEGMGKEIEKSLAEPKVPEQTAELTADQAAEQSAMQLAASAAEQPLELKPDTAAIAGPELQLPPAATPEPLPEPAAAVTEPANTGPANTERTG
jgi:sec-independent protein translocase protein TatB